MQRLLPLLLMLTVLLAACAKPVPADKVAYIGTWQGPGVRLTIEKNGMVTYWRRQGTSTINSAAPLQGFNGDDFDVGVGVMSTRFHVVVPPHEEMGKVKMTIDNLTLTRNP